MDTPDWPALYTTEVAPAMQRFAEGPPTAVWAAVAGMLVIGVGWIALTSGSTRLGGLVPIGFDAVAFVVTDGTVLR